MRAFRYQVWHQKKNIAQVQKFSFGLAVGYWPCLLAPYVRFDLWHVQIYFWFGLPSYQFQRLTRFSKTASQRRATGALQV